MTFDDYSSERLASQGEARPVEERLALAGMGLCGEAGEACELIKKHLFHGRPLDKELLTKELGDVLWYVMFCADAIGTTLEAVAAANNEKLRKRYPNGWSVQAAATRVLEQDGGV